METSPRPAAHGAATARPRPSHVADLLRLVTREPGRPRLTWYGDDGERVELSGAVLENWINKTTNLLVEEFDAGPGTRVVVDLPVHWRTVLWTLAAWRTGATVVLVDDAAADAADVVVTSRPGEWAGHRADVVAVALPALARRFDGDLPAGVVDAASAVMTYGDQVGWCPAPDLAEPALVHAGDDDVAHGDLVPAPRHDAGARVLLRGDGPVGGAVRDVLDVLAEDGSVVLASAGRSAALDADDVARERLVAAERVTAP